MAETLKEQAAEAESIAFDDFSSLIQRDFKPKNDESRDKIQAAVATLAQQALEDATTISDDVFSTCLLYTSPSPRDATLSRMPSSA